MIWAKACPGVLLSSLQAAAVTAIQDRRRLGADSAAKQEEIAWAVLGRAKFAGRFPALEDELCGLTWGGDYPGPGKSPDRADAMVWAMTELMLGTPAPEPRVRGL
jgi:phage terminase large subunit-like protein